MRIGIIGGGAAGMVAAITAARAGAEVTIFEKMDRVGKKLLATGNGRCNISNEHMELFHFHGAAPDFIKAVMEAVSPVSYTHLDVYKRQDDECAQQGIRRTGSV